jgi:hypothetical protein
LSSVAIWSTVRCAIRRTPASCSTDRATRAPVRCVAPGSRRSRRCCPTRRIRLNCVDRCHRRGRRPIRRPRLRRRPGLLRPRRANHERRDVPAWRGAAPSPVETYRPQPSLPDAHQPRQPPVELDAVRRYISVAAKVQGPHGSADGESMSRPIRPTYPLLAESSPQFSFGAVNRTVKEPSMRNGVSNSVA